MNCGYEMCAKSFVPKHCNHHFCSHRCEEQDWRDRHRVRYRKMVREGQRKLRAKWSAKDRQHHNEAQRRRYHEGYGLVRKIQLCTQVSNQ